MAFSRRRQFLVVKISGGPELRGITFNSIIIFICGSAISDTITDTISKMCPTKLTRLASYRLLRTASRIGCVVRVLALLSGGSRFEPWS